MKQRDADLGQAAAHIPEENRAATAVYESCETRGDLHSSAAHATYEARLSEDVAVLERQAKAEAGVVGVTIGSYETEQDNHLPGHQAAALHAASEPHQADASSWQVREAALQFQSRQVAYAHQNGLEVAAARQQEQNRDGSQLDRAFGARPAAAADYYCTKTRPYPGTFGLTASQSA